MLCNLVRRFGGDRGGDVAIIFALSLVPCMLLAGMRMIAPLGVRRQQIGDRGRLVRGGSADASIAAKPLMDCRGWRRC